MGCLLGGLEKNGKIGSFSGRLWVDWGDTTRAATASLGSMGFELFTGFPLLPDKEQQIQIT